MTAYAFIPARGGSTRVPRKNLALVGGRSLVASAIDVAHEAGLHAVVSTEDSEIAAVAAALGAEVHARPAGLATSLAQIEPAIVHWLLRCDDAQTIALLQPTSPFRTASIVRRCLEALERGYDTAVTVHLDASRAFFWGRMRGERVVWERDAGHRPPTQTLEPVAIENGCCYAFGRHHMLRTKSRMGGRECAVVIERDEAIDIDTPADLDLARAIAEMRRAA